MVLPLLGMAVVSAVLTGAITWGAARRYGRGRAFLVPVLALGAVMFLMWRTDTTGAHDPFVFAPFAVVAAGSSVGGALLGLLLARRRVG
ncbi:MAG: hypothetical protein JNK19_05395 [Tabrizicola sp.]|nr:hypothetical protein [Tabrizicola sp.]